MRQSFDSFGQWHSQALILNDQLELICDQLLRFCRYNVEALTMSIGARSGPQIGI